MSDTYHHFIPKIEIGTWVQDAVDAFVNHTETFFTGLGNGINWFVEQLVDGFTWINPFVFIIIVAAIAFWRSGWGVAIFSLVGLWFIFDLGYWPDTMQTLGLILTAIIISIIIGIPFGIWIGLSDAAKNIITPILDFMQTMPAFVYLIPVLFLFGTGMAPGVVATVIFSMPPTIRMAGLGIRQVPEDLIEASEAFGSTTSQKLFKVQLPLAMKTIMAGINQSIMLALSMVVIASLVAAPGLGAKVYLAVTQLRLDIGVESGLAIVIIAIVLDRITQNTRKNKS
ncbi:glycine betaine/proline transport system permease protein [Pullulanibacillus pueri]|uniref:Glycine betaine transport system permease protein OpuAB n=1 Tax=Pullulanibacillus pueri TaxID=1437324 RepID=A0A8J3ENW2_9BACL|nr:ABC transporter permease subunit [Pullulanibacillus pueri]MBM7683748.1 glycine betaine/proline transport system permease protein [Pullulanibacillus pueri]GGH87359.1 glycine betaine transport system permease protein OpuAB [Pullulanibacillus pueri]